MDEAALATLLVERHGTTLAEEAGIQLADEPGPLWQLLVLALLLARRIPSTTAVATARQLWSHGWTTPEATAASTWRQRVDALGRGGYRRYDFSTSTRLGDDAATVLDRWQGDLRRLRDEADGDAARIARALQRLDGVGPTAAGIYLREVQGVWPAVAPYADALTTRGAALAGLPTDPARLAALVPPADLPRLCAALVRAARRPSLLA